VLTGPNDPPRTARGSKRCRLGVNTAYQYPPKAWQMPADGNESSHPRNCSFIRSITKPVSEYVNAALTTECHASVIMKVISLLRESTTLMRWLGSAGSQLERAYIALSSQALQPVTTRE
jgi:hypothetical protein